MTPRPPIIASTIPYAHWSMKVGRTAPAWGEIVHQLDDLEQGIANLLFTPKGSVPTEPEKGCDLLEIMDRPPAIAIPRIKGAMFESLFEWHKRIRVEAVDVRPVDDEEFGFSHFHAPVFWFPVDGVVEEPIETVIDVTRNRLLAAGAVLQ